LSAGAVAAKAEQEKLAFTLCLAGIAAIGFVSGIYDYVAALM
jgi:hypothetical protein